MTLTDTAAVEAADSSNTPASAGPSFATLALHRIALSTTNPRTTHGRTRLLQLLDNAETMNEVRRLLDHPDEQSTAELTEILGSAKMAEMVSSVHTLGVNQAVLVRPLPASRLADTADAGPGQRPDFELVAGERRWLASALAGKDTIPAMVKAMSDQEVLEFQLAENLQREDLHPMEEAEGYERLCADTGMDKDAIGQKIGKSRSYVYGRLKLLDLCQEARRAFYDGQIDASKALLIARVPDEKLQIKAVTHAITPQWNGFTPSVRDFQVWLQNNVMLSLKHATFDIKAADLVPRAGACTTCPKRTGANPELFQDVDSADVCTDPKCFDAKKVAHAEAQAAQARAKGQTVIQGKEAQALYKDTGQPEGYVEVDYRSYEPGLGVVSLREMAGDDMPEPTLVMHPRTHELVAVLPLAEAQALKIKVKEAALERRRQELQKEADQREQAAKKADDDKPRTQEQLQRDVSDAWQVRMLEAMHAALQAGTMQQMAPVYARWLASRLLDHIYGMEDIICKLVTGQAQVGATAGLQEFVEQCPDEQVAPVLLLAIAATCFEDGDDRATIVQQLASDLQVDMDALHDEVSQQVHSIEQERLDAIAARKAAEKAAAKPAKTEKTPSPAAPAGGKKGGGGKKAEKAAPKVKAADVQSDLAAALAAVPEGGAITFEVGQQVRIKSDLRVNGKLRKLAGQLATVEGKMGDRAWVVRFGKKDGDVTSADYTELDPVEAPADAGGAEDDDTVTQPDTAKATLRPEQAWPFAPKDAT